MLFEIVAHVCVPLIAVACLIIFKAATRKRDVGWEDCNEVALELAILAIGSTGGIFANPNLITRMGQNAGEYGILVVLIDLLFAALIVYRGKPSDTGTKVSGKRATGDLFIGCVCIAFTVGIIYKSY